MTPSPFRTLPLLMAAVLAMLSAPLRAEDTPSEKPDAYPLTICVVSGRPLGSMGPAFIHHENGHEVRFCCKGCLPEFQKHPEAYLEKIEKAREANADAPHADPSGGATEEHHSH